ncbi:MAG: shikimate dehydrogenase family protein [Lawsonibacter sp.]
MHNEACALLGLDYHYLAFDVPLDRLETAVAGLKAMGVKGFNLTMPDKNKMVALCDELSPAAKICGAVNTVVNYNGRLIGHTTDGIGYVMSARDAGFDLVGKARGSVGRRRHRSLHSGPGRDRRRGSHRCFQSQ